tara:strand:- start:716 stop:850 length:135 start_codon:yes stop_codon:yes gene_type:complete
MDVETKKIMKKDSSIVESGTIFALIGVDFKRQNRKYYEKSNQIL